MNGQRTPDGEQLWRLAELLGVDSAWLRDGAGAEPADLRRQARLQARDAVGWIPRLAPIDGGRDGGNANQFTIKATIDNLVREAIQNADDESMGDLHGPVAVRFRLLSLRGEAKRRFLEAMQWEQLDRHVQACIEQSANQQVAGGLQEARDMANSGELLVLQISDRNTRGLIGPETGRGNFAALTRDNLFSEKNSETAGGSYGLGKAMQYAASAFACVLFSSELSEPEPATGNTHGRFFARAELVYHEIGDQRYSGPVWLGRAEDGDSGRPVSYWGDGERDALLRDLHMVRRAGDTGTTIAIVGLRDLDADRRRPPWEIVGQMADAAERNFWPAIAAGRLEVQVQYIEVDDPDAEYQPKLDRLVDPANSRVVGPYLAALRAWRDGTTDELLVDDGDVVGARVPLSIPARKAGKERHPALTHEAVVLVRRATAEEEADETSRTHLRRGVLMRGSNMIVKSLDLSRGALGARPFQVVVLTGRAVGDDVADERAEVFLRAAEPPSHDNWEYTPRLRNQYVLGAKKALSDFESAIRREVRRILQVEAEHAPDGPRDLSQRFKFGEPTPPERAPRVVVRTNRVDDDGAWHVEAVVRLPGDLRRPVTGRPQVVFLGESGGRSRVRWRHLEAMGAGIAVIDDDVLLIAAQTRTARFRGVTDPDTHPAPAAQTTATLQFQPATREEGR
jgi:RNA polymerase primary sigma factor